MKGLLAGIVLVASISCLLLYSFQAVLVGAQTRLALAQAERLEAQTMLQQAATIDYLARAQVGTANRLWIAVAVLMTMVLFAMIGAVLALLAEDRHARNTVMYQAQQEQYRRPVQRPMEGPYKPPYVWVRQVVPPDRSGRA